MKKKISVSKLSFPTCFYHESRLGKFQVTEGEEIFFLCENCYQKKSQDGSLVSEEDSPEIQLDNNSSGRIDTKLFRTSSIASIPGGKGKFSWENWGSFGKENSQYLRRSLRKINGKTLEEIYFSLLAKFTNLDLAWDTGEKTPMNYDGKDLILVKDFGKLYLFFPDGKPFAELERIGKIIHIYKKELETFRHLEGKYGFR